MRLSALRKQKLFNSLVALSLGFNFIFSNAALALDKDRQVYELRGMSAGERLGSSPLLDFVLQSLYRNSGISGLKKILADLALRAPEDPVEKALKEGAGNIVIVEDKAGNLYRVSLEGNGSKTKINLAEKEESATEGFASVEAFLEFIAASNKIWASGSEYTPQQIIDAQREVKDYFQKAIRQKRIFANEGLDIQINEYLAERISRGLPALTTDEGKKLKERLEKAFSFHNRMLKNAETKLRKIAFILDEEPPFINLDGPQSSIFRMVAAGLERESYPFPLDLVEAYNSPAAKEEDIFPMYRALMERYLGIDKDVFHQLRLPSLWQGVSAELKNRRHSAAKKRIEEESRMSIAEVHSVNISGFVNVLDEKAKTALTLAASVELEKRLKSGLFQRYSLDWNRGDMLIFTLRANKPGLVNDSRVLPAINSAALAALEEAKRRGIYKGSDLGKEFRSQVQTLKISRERSLKYSGEPQGWVKEVFGIKNQEATLVNSAIITDYSAKKIIRDIPYENLRGRVVYVRVDWNIKDFKDMTRVVETFELIRYLKQAGAKCVLQSHRERYKDIKSAAEKAGLDFKGLDISSLYKTPALEKFSLKPIVNKAVELLRKEGILSENETISFIPSCFGDTAAGAIRNMRDGEVAALENPRFYAEEELEGETEDEAKKKEVFSRKILEAVNPDIIVFDAPGSAHRGGQPTAGDMYKFSNAPKVAGLLMGKEMNNIAVLTQSRNMGVIIGGAKIDEKISVLEGMIKRGGVKALLVDGGAAIAFIKAQGKEAGKSLGVIYKGDEKAIQEAADSAKKVLELAQTYGTKIILPEKVVTTKEEPSSAKQDGYSTKVKDADKIEADDYVPDIPKDEIQRMGAVKEFQAVNTIFLNGTAGDDRMRQFQEGTDAQADIFINHPAPNKVVGGGDGLAAFNRRVAFKNMKIPGNIKTSTMGGSLFYFLEDGRLSSLDTLDDKAQVIKEDAAFELLKKQKSINLKEVKKEDRPVWERVLDEMARTRWTVKKESVNGETVYFYRPMRLLIQANNKTDLKTAKNLGADGILAGHSEAREEQGLTNQDVNSLLGQAFKEGLTHNVMAFGEPAELRYPKGDKDEGKLRPEGKTFLGKQVSEGLGNLPEEWKKDLTFAYEPIWAIGVKAIRPAKPQEAEEVHKAIRDQLSRIVPGEENNIIIQYGGSMSAKNGSDLMAEPDVDGGLIGTASLKKEDALQLIRTVVAAVRAQKKTGVFSGRIPVIGFNLKAEAGGKKMEESYLKELMDTYRFIEENLRGIDLENDVRIFFALPQTDIFLFDRALKGQRPMDLLDLSRTDLPDGIKLAVDIKEVSQFEPGAHTASLTAETLRLAGIKKVWNSEGVSTDDPRIRRANEAGLEVFQGADISFATTIEGIRRLLDNPSKDKIIVIPPALAREAHAYAIDQEKEKLEVSSAIDRKAEIVKDLELRNDAGKSNFPAHILMENPALFSQARNFKVPIYSKSDQTIYVWDADSLEEAVRKQYAEGKNDEAMTSIITVGDNGLPLARLAQGGAIFNANYRKDRQIQWIDAIVNKRFKGFNVPAAAKNIVLAGMTKYTTEFPQEKTVIADEKVEDGLVETLYQKNIAMVVVFDGEKGKFVPVFRGGKEEPYPNEDLEFASISMPVLMNKGQIERYNPDVSARLREEKDEYIAWFYKDVPQELEKQKLSNSQYWLYPGLSALLLAKLNAQKIMSAKPGTLGVTNIDLPDLIGHVAIKNLKKAAELFIEKEDGSFEIKKGNGWDSVLECLKISDKAEEIILKALEERGGALILVGDHGSVDDMTQPNHSFNEVPVFIVDFKHKDVKLVKSTDGAKNTQANVAVTALHILGIKKPDGMTGRSLLPESYAGSKDRIVWYNILDGFGHTDLNDPQNAFGVAMAKEMMPRIKELYAQNNYLLLKASGHYAGLRGARQEDFNAQDILSRKGMLETVKTFRPAMIKITYYDYRDIPGASSLYDYKEGVFELGYSPFLNDKDFTLRWSDGRTLEVLCLDLSQMGSTEYNTWTLGAGSIVKQSVVSLDELFIRGDLSRNQAIKAYAELAKKQGYAHFTEILQEAGVHASARQLYYLIKHLKDKGVSKFVFDLGSDGRDEPAQDTIKRIGELRSALKYFGISDYIINIRGREICFDRDNKWYLTEGWLNELLWGSRVNRRADFILQDLRGIYQQIAPQYAAIWGMDVQEEVVEHRENFAKLIPAGGKIVDIGTIGRDIDWFGKRGFEAVGISDNPEMLKEAGKLYPGLLLQEMDARRLKFKTGSQDGIWDNATFHHIPPESAGQVLKEYARVLHPEGILFIRVKEGEGEIYQEVPEYPGKKRYFKLYGEQELKDLAASYGFEIIRSGVQSDSDVTGRITRGEDKKWVYIFARKKTDTGPARDSQFAQDVTELAKNGFGSQETQLDLSLKGIVPQVSSSIESLAQLKASLGSEKGQAGGNEDIFNSILNLQDEGMDYGLSEAALSRQEEKIILIDGSVLENDYSSLLTIGRINRQFNERLGVFEEKGQAVTAANPENPYKFILVGGKLKDRKAVEGLLAVAAKRELGKSDPLDEEVRERVRDYQKRFTKILTQEDMYDKLDFNNSPSIENPEYVLRQLRWTLGAGFSADKVLAFVGPREWVEGFKKHKDISSQAQGIIVGQEKDKISLAGRGLYAAVEENKDKYVMVESQDIAAGIEEEIRSYRKEVDAYI